MRIFALHGASIGERGQGLKKRPGSIPGRDGFWWELTLPRSWGFGDLHVVNVGLRIPAVVICDELPAFVVQLGNRSCNRSAHGTWSPPGLDLEMMETTEPRRAPALDPLEAPACRRWGCGALPVEIAVPSSRLSWQPIEPMPR